MGSATPFDEDKSIEEKIKNLADEELLDIWAESQFVENMINSRLPEDMAFNPDFEQVIITELYLRASRRMAGI